MLVCPDCGADDLIEGVDECEHCGQTLTDLFIRVPKFSVEADLLRDRIGDLPSHPPVEVAPSTTVGEALRMMVEERIGCVLIVVDENLAGVFSERDALVKLGADGARLSEQPLVKFMTPNPAVVAASDRIAVALHKMDLGGYRHLPVMEGEKPVSIISVRDILRYLTDHSRQASA